MEFGIDFDEASKCWRQNKKYIGNGMFVYICGYIHSNGKQCRRTIYSQTTTNPYSTIYHNLEINKYHNHKNKDFFCKQHLNSFYFGN